MPLPPGLTLISPQNPSLTGLVPDDEEDPNAPVMQPAGTPPIPGSVPQQTPTAPPQQPGGLPPGLVPIEEKSDPGEERPDYEQMEWADVLRLGYHNLDDSALKLVNDTFQAVVNIDDTAKGLFNMVLGGVEKAVPGRQEHEEAFDAVIDFYKDRYTSLAGFKKAIAKDPTGVLVDMASFLTPGGTALKGLGAVSKSKALANIGKVIAKGKYLDPTVAVPAVLSKAPRLITSKAVPLAIYDRATKLGLNMPKAMREKVVKFAYDKNFLPTVKGIDKIQGKLNLLGREVSDIIDRATVTGHEIPVKRLMYGLKELEQMAEITEFGRSGKARKALAEIRKDIYKTHIKNKSGKLSVAEVQQIKQDINKKFSGFYDSYSSSPIEPAAFKKIANNAKNALEELIPQLQDLKHVREIKGSKASLKDVNSLQHKYLNVLKAIDRVQSPSLMDPITKMQQMRKANLGHTIGAPEMAGMVLIDGVLNNRNVRARIGLLLKHMQEVGMKVDPVLYPTFSAGRLPERIDEDKD